MKIDSTTPLKKIIGSRYVFTIKYKLYEFIDQCKLPLIVNRYTQSYDFLV